MLHQVLRRMVHDMYRPISESLLVRGSQPFSHLRSIRNPAESSLSRDSRPTPAISREQNGYRLIMDIHVQSDQQIQSQEVSIELCSVCDCAQPGQPSLQYPFRHPKPLREVCNVHPRRHAIIQLSTNLCRPGIYQAREPASTLVSDVDALMVLLT